MLPSVDVKSLDPKRQLLDINRADCEESLYEFYKGAWQYIDPAPWVDSWAIDAISEHLQAVCDGDIKRLIINISPRCSKSNLVSVAFPAWVWAQAAHGPISGPGVPFLHASYANQLSLRDSVKCRRLIETPWYQERWGDRFQLTSDQNTKSRFTNDKGGERLITSIDGTNTGEGGMCFVAGTKVSTPHGERNIEDLRPGDSVYAFDTIRGKVVKSHTLATAKRQSNDLCTLYETSGHRITCTQDHPIFSPGRGYIAAGDMGPGDRIIVSGKILESHSDTHTSEVRLLREENKTRTIFGKKSVKTRIDGRILFESMFRKTSCIQEFHKNLFILQNKFSKAWKTVLFGRVQNEGSRRKEKEKRMSALRNVVFWELQQNILFEQMCGQSTFNSHEGCEKFQVQRNWKVLKSIQGNEKIDQRERQLSLRCMQRSGTNNEEELSSENFVTHTSYRREFAEQLSGQLDNALRKLSLNPPSTRIGHISKIVRHSHSEVDVYDIQVERFHNFFAEGILSSNCIIIDDPNAVDDAESEATIQTAIDWWTGTMPTRLNNQDTGAYIIIQQRTFENDLTGYILETEADEWVHLMIPMRYEPDRSFVTSIGWKDPRHVSGELMWPERFGEAAVKRLEKRLGPFATAGQLQQRPEPAGGGIIKRDWWLLWDRDVFPPMDFIMGVLDTAYTEDTMNDPSGMIVWGIFAETKATSSRMIDTEGRPIYMDRTISEGGPHAMLMNAWDDRLELHQLVLKVAETAIKYKIDMLVIENKASGISVAQEIRRLYSNEKFSVQLFDPKSQDKIARLYSIQHLFAEGLIYAPNRPWSERVITQVGQFPKGKHDEFVDLTSMGLRKLRDMGLLVRADEHKAEIESQKTYPGNQTVALYPG